MPRDFSGGSGILLEDSLTLFHKMPPLPSIHPDLKALFEFTRRRVTEDDIWWNVPNDPGSQGYSDLWKGIRLTGGIPCKYEVNLSEVINLTRWGKPQKEKKPKSFLAFRRFTSAVGLIQISWGLGDDAGENYLAHNLLTDRIHGNPQHLDLLRRAFAFTGRFLKDQTGYILSHDYPFFILGEMMLAEWAGDHAAAGSHAARLLIQEEEIWTDPEAHLPGRKDGRFLFCVTRYNQFEAEWTDLVAKLKNPEKDPNIARVMDLFAGGSR